VSKDTLGNLNKDTVSDILNNDRHKLIQKEILENKLPKGCSNCKIGPDSFKKTMVKKFEKYLPNKSFYQNEGNFELRLADLRFRNTCNYACIYCGPELSSLWASINNNSYINIESETRTDLIEYILTNATTLNDVMLAGGEPLLIKENEIILQKLLEVNPNVQIFVNTNLSQIKNNKIYDLLLKFKNVCWIVSVEDIGDRYNYIRWPGTWDNFYHNLLELKKIEGHDITFNMVYTILNYKSIFDCINLLKNNGFVSFTITYVSGKAGYWLDPRHLPTEQLEDIKNFLKLKIDTGTEKNTYQTLLNKINEEYKPNINTVLERLKKFDSDRKLNSQYVFPDLYKLINIHYE